MLNGLKIFQIISVRFVHTSNINAGIANTMHKILKRPKKRKPFYEERIALPNSNPLEKEQLAPKNQGCKRRVSVLNKLFMRHITDLMSTGEMASLFAGWGLEINRVEVTPDYHGLNIFWIAKHSPKDVDVEEVLKRTSKKLRHELTVLRVMGIVPKIYFIKDRHYAQIVEIDNRLAKADFGEDYQPSEVYQQMKTQLMINMTLQPKVKEQIQQLEESLPKEEQDEIPDMPQDVLGLNHKEIMDRIQNSIKRSSIKPKALNPDDSLVKTVNTQPVEFKSAKTQREAFKQFLMERQVLKRKLRKANSQQKPDFEYLEEECIILRKQEMEEGQPLTVEDKDYIEEDVDDSELSYK